MKAKNKRNLQSKSKDVQRLKQLEQQASKQSKQSNQQKNQQQQSNSNKQPQHHRNNILLVVIVILLFVVVLYAMNLSVSHKEKASQEQQEKQKVFVPYEKLIEEEKQQINDDKQIEQQQISPQELAADAPDAKQEIEQQKIISEEKLLEQQKAEQQFSLESQLSSEYTQYFLGACKDSDGGKNFYEQGSAVSKTGSAELDECSTAIQYPNRLYEFYCDKNEMARKMTFECPNGCKQGACVAEK
jgi:cytoskeletal protein RodZ